ncbi:protein-L-isoaspartate O-methyltransferase [bacterium]|nr:protein-L-isoaspartate O-methyltransferase [bacterium]
MKHLKKREVLKTPEIISAFEDIDRIDFVRPEDRNYAYADVPLGIGYGQTISQPFTVAFMLEQLKPKKGHKILDVGSGSGWTTALLAHIVGESGTVVGMEIIPELVSFGRSNLQKYGFKNATIEQATEGSVGKPDQKFDRILVSAAAREMPQELILQLKPNGVLVIPVENSIFKVNKDSKGNITDQEFPGFAFVPLKP